MFLLTAASYNCHNNMNLTKQLEGSCGLSYHCDAWTPVSSIYHGRQSRTTGGPPGRPYKVQNGRVQRSTSYHSETTAVETCISYFLMFPHTKKTSLHDKTNVFCQQNALTWRMRQGKVYSTILTLITFYGSHFGKRF